MTHYTYLFIGLLSISSGILVFLHSEFSFSVLWWFDFLVLIVVALSIWSLSLLAVKKMPELPHAFMSYSHVRDSALVPAIRHAILIVAKPLTEIRVRYALLDRTDLKEQGASQSELETALGALVGRSKFFVLLASREAAVSDWVAFEINSFLAKNSSRQLLIALTDGKIVWNPAMRDFDWHKTNALPRCLSGKFDGEPTYVDLRSVRGRLTGKRTSDRELRDLIAPLVAAIDQSDLRALMALSVRSERRAKVVIWLNLLLIGIMVLTLIIAKVRKG